MNICVVFLRVQSGGNLTYTLNLIRYLQKTSLDFTLLVSSKTLDIVKRDIENYASIKLIEKNVPNNIFLSIIYERFHVIGLSGFGFDIVIFPNTLLPFCSFDSLLSVCVIHDLNFQSISQGFLKDFYKKKLYSYAANNAKLRVHISNFTLSQYYHFLGENVATKKGKDIVVWNGVSFPQGYVRSMATEEPYLLTFAHQPHKNVEESISVFLSVFAMCSHIKLYVIGSGSYAKMLSGKFTHKNIIYTGYVKQDYLESLYSGALAVLFLSKYEGFGLPVFEAFQRKVPIIISSHPALLEVASGKAFIHEDIVSTVSYICRLLTDSVYRINIEEEASCYVSNFTWDHQFGKMMEAITDVSGSA